MTSCNIEKHSQLNKSFDIFAFDWDGTAVPDRTYNAEKITNSLEKLLQKKVYIAIITGTNINNINKQFSHFIKGPHKKQLYICTNRGSEVYNFPSGIYPQKIYDLEATETENIQLNKSAEAVKQYIENNSNLTVDITYNRLNRRKIDLIPEWEHPKKSEIDILLSRTKERLKKGGFKGGIKKVFEYACFAASNAGLQTAKITSDVKHIEIGLTDKSDSINWIITNIAKPAKISDNKILVGGDEFGEIGGFAGSDSKMILKNHPEIVYFSVGVEPNGVPPQVINLGGGPKCFQKVTDNLLKH